MTTNENPAAIRVCAIADIQCSRGCGTGECKREPRYPVEQPAPSPADERAAFDVPECNGSHDEGQIAAGDKECTACAGEEALPVLLTAQDLLMAIDTFEIVGENNDSREPNADDRFILTEFIAHAFRGFTVEPRQLCYQCKGCGDNDAAPGWCVRCNGAGIEPVPIATISSMKAHERAAKRDVRQLADWLLTDPQTGSNLHFSGPLERDFLGMSRVKMQSEAGDTWTLTAGLKEGYLSAEQRAGNMLRIAAIEREEAREPTIDQLVEMAYLLELVPRGETVCVQFLDVLRRQYRAAMEASGV